MLFIILNQVFQSELGYVDISEFDFLEIKYKNTSYIWGPHDEISNFIAKFTPDVFKVVPVGEYEGQMKYWPWFWLIVPAYLFVTPLCFLISMIFDYKNLKLDIIRVFSDVNIKKNKNNY